MLTLFSSPVKSITPRRTAQQSNAQSIAIAFCIVLCITIQAQASDKTISTGDSKAMKQPADEANKQTTKNTTKPTAVDKYAIESLESISQVVFDGETLGFTVISNGCTRAEHFSVKEDLVDGRCLLTVQRDTPDFCRRAPLPVDLSISWQPSDACASKEIIIANPLLTTWQGKLPRTQSDD